MTSREIILANLDHADPERPGFTHPSPRINDMLGAGISPPENWNQQRWVEGNLEFYNDEWGNLWQRMVHGSVKGEILKPAIEDWSQLENLEVPDYDNPRLYQRAKEIFSEPTDKFKLGHIGGWVFDNARYMRKLEIYLMDLILHRPEIDRLHQMVTDVYEAKIHHMAQCGADGVMIGEDLGTQTGPLMGPAMWREIFKPIYKHLTGVAHDYGLKVLLHSCGQNWLLIDDLAEAGIDCFQFDQPAAYDMPALAEKFKQHKVALWSPVDIQKVLPTGDKDFIEAEAKRMVEIFQGFLIVGRYGDLKGIGVEPAWDEWAYQAVLDKVNEGGAGQ